MHGWSGVLAGVVASACASCADEEEFTFFASDMQAVVEGEWVGTVTHPDGTSEPATLALFYTQVDKAGECEERYLSDDAPLLRTQCVSLSVGGVHGTLAVGDLGPDYVPGVYTDESPALLGFFIVSGPDLDGAGDLSMQPRSVSGDMTDEVRAAHTLDGGIADGRLDVEADNGDRLQLTRR